MPLPYPRSWYFVAPAASLGPDDAVRARLCGRDVEVRRSADGTLLSDLPVVEQNGLLLAWHDPHGRPPAWSVPACDDDGWTAPAFTSVDVRTHPQHVMHDLADLPHFESVHRYAALEVVDALRTEGPALSLGVRFGWDTALPVLRANVAASFHSVAWGLGYQVTDVRVPLFQLATRHFVMPVPVDPGTTRTWLGVAQRGIGALGAIEARLGGPLRPLHAALRPFVMRMFLRDVGRDAELWERRHAANGAAGPDVDGARYLAWAGQFYGV